VRTLAGEPLGTAGDRGPQPDDDRSAAGLDDDADRKVLRQRYYGLLQELRVLLPGVQVLLAFLFTVPFASHFDELDRPGRVAFAVSMCSATVATIAFVAPIAFHRVGHRRARSARLVWAIRMEATGLGFMCVALLAGLWCVTRLVFGAAIAGAITAVLTATVVALWIVVPLAADRPSASRGGTAVAE
jgi:hypothetical protein